MCDVHGYIKSLTPPLSRDAIYREMVKQDASITRGTISSALKELGYTAKPMRVQGGCGVAHLWIPRDFETKQSEPEPEKAEPKSTEQIIDEVEERNEHTTSLNAKLLETLNVSRGLKAEMIARQQEVLVDMARRILGLYGSEKERKAYGVI